jgi:hypothetical protein
MRVRWIRKTAVLGLAAYGAYQLYELVRPRAVQLRTNAVPPLEQAVDTAKVAAGQVRDDITSAKDDIVDDVKTAVDDEQELLGTAAHEARMAVDGEHPEPSTPGSGSVAPGYS